MTEQVQAASTADHPCEELNYNELYVVLLRGSVGLAEMGNHELSEELASTAVALRSDLRNYGVPIHE